MVEHLTADQEVPGSNPGAPCWVAKFGNINFKTSLLLFIFCQTDFFSVDEDKIFRKSGPHFFTFDFGGFWKNQSPDFEVKLLLFDVVKMMQILDLKSWLQTKADQEIYRFKSSCPLWTWNIWNIQSEIVDVVKIKYGISLLLFWGFGCMRYSSVVEHLTTHEEVPSSNPGAPFAYGGQ